MADAKRPFWEPSSSPVPRGQRRRAGLVIGGRGGPGVGRRLAPDPERRWSYWVVLTLLETHRPKAFNLLAPVPYFVAKAATSAARSVLQDLAAAIVAA
jgi:hypothetical protein